MRCRTTFFCPSALHDPISVSPVSDKSSSSTWTSVVLSTTCGSLRRRRQKAPQSGLSGRRRTPTSRRVRCQPSCCFHKKSDPRCEATKAVVHKNRPGGAAYLAGTEKYALHQNLKYFEFHYGRKVLELCTNRENGERANRRYWFYRYPYFQKTSLILHSTRTYPLENCSSTNTLFNIQKTQSVLASASESLVVVQYRGSSLRVYQLGISQSSLSAYRYLDQLLAIKPVYEVWRQTCCFCRDKSRGR